MPTLAAAEGQIIFVLFAIVYGIFSMWQAARKKQQDAELEERIRRNQPRTESSPSAPNSPNAPYLPASAPATEPPDGPSDQERLRRFLEALGVPNTPPPPAPAPAAPVYHPPAPPRRAFPVPAPAPRHPMPRPSIHPDPEPVSLESREPGEFSETAREIENTAQSNTPPAVVTSRPKSKGALTVVDALQSPEKLRAAFLIREILGPPPGLDGADRSAFWRG